MLFPLWETNMRSKSELEPIAYMRTDFPTKFGIPRQSNLIDAEARIIFEPKYRIKEAFRGLEEYSYIWVIWEFSEAVDKKWSPTVRPPRLGGNTRIGVFATRSPFRPNSIGLSCLQLVRVEWDGKEGPVLIVKGADMVDGTPVYDIKPYLPYVDSHPDAKSGFAGKAIEYSLSVSFTKECEGRIDEEEKKILIQILEQDPRPAYQNNPERVYGMEYAGMEIKFQVDGKNLTVIDIIR